MKIKWIWTHLFSSQKTLTKIIVENYHEIQIFLLEHPIRKKPSSGFHHEYSDAMVLTHWLEKIFANASKVSSKISMLLLWLFQKIFLTSLHFTNGSEKNIHSWHYKTSKSVTTWTGVRLPLKFAKNKWKKHETKIIAFQNKICQKLSFNDNHV